MSNIGYYIYKTTATVDVDVNFLVGGVVDSTKSIKVIEGCDEDYILKYLDKNGQYRFYAFNKFSKIIDSPELIGTTNKFVTNILSDQSDKHNVGYRNERKLNLTADVSNEALTKLVDIYVSPRVYLYIGSNNSDTKADWLEVSISASENIVKREKAKFGRVDLIVTLPSNYSISMI